MPVTTQVECFKFEILTWSGRNRRKRNLETIPIYAESLGEAYEKADHYAHLTYPGIKLGLCRIAS